MSASRLELENAVNQTQSNFDRLETIIMTGKADYTTVMIFLMAWDQLDKAKADLANVLHSSVVN